MIALSNEGTASRALGRIITNLGVPRWMDYVSAI